MAPFNYTGRKVLGPTSYWKEVKKELARVELCTGKPWSYCCGEEVSEYPLNEVLEGGRYEFVYAGGWRAKVDAHLKLCCITDIIDHIVKEGDAAFADTPYSDSWIICHDALSQYWEAGATEYLRAKGFGPERMIMCQDGTNAGTRYEGKLVGNRPELMPLDSNLFADLVFAMKQHCAITADLHRDDPQKFNLGTPDKVWDCMARSWEVAPTPNRICRCGAALYRASYHVAST